jgi:hypothetical protein
VPALRASFTDYRLPVTDSYRMRRFVVLGGREGDSTVPGELCDAA